MKGRLAGWIALLGLAVACLLQIGRAGDRVTASRVLQRVEQSTVLLGQQGRLTAQELRLNIQELLDAMELAPDDVRLRLALGGQYLLLNHPQQAVKTYREALAVEARPELYLNLGRAQQAAGDLEGARASYQAAALLNPLVRRAIPAELRPADPRALARKQAERAEKKAERQRQKKLERQRLKKEKRRQERLERQRQQGGGEPEPPTG